MRKTKGFTFIEILITISIISILATLGITNFRGSQEQARDIQRKSDLRQYHIALENFATAKNGFYPSRTSTVRASTTLCSDLGNFIAGCPEDPRNAKDSNLRYRYKTDGSGGGSPTALNWVLWDLIERSDNTTWVVCSNGKSGEAGTTFSAQNGECPL